MSAALAAAKARLAYARSSLPPATADKIVFDGDLGLVQELVLTLEAQERDIQRVIDVWSKPDPDVAVAHWSRVRVTEQWPVFANAIARLMMSDRDVRRRPPEREIPPA